MRIANCPWLAALVPALACASSASTPDGGTTGMAATPLATQLLSETSGTVAAKAYDDHDPSANETAQVAVFLAFAIQAQQTGALDPGFLASSEAVKVRAIALEYADFFASAADGGLALKAVVNSPADFSCTNDCDPGAAAFTTAFTAGLPRSLPSLVTQAAQNLASTVDQSAQTLEQSGTPQGTAFDQAIGYESTNIVDDFVGQFVQSELATGDGKAAAASLGLSPAQEPGLLDAVAAVCAGIVLAQASSAIDSAASLSAQCQVWKSSNCGAATGGGTTGG